MHFIRISIVALIAAFAAITPPLFAQNAPPAKSTSQVAVIDLKLVYSNMKETIDSDRELTSMRGQLDQMTRFHHDDLDALRRAANQKNPQRSADELIARQDEFDKKTLESEHEEQTLKLKIVRAQARQLKITYDEIRKVVNQLAKEKGLDLVLVASSAELPPNTEDISNPQTLTEAVFNHGMLYASDSTDITVEVITRLNAPGPGKNFVPPPTTAPLPATAMRIGSKTFQLEIAADDPSREKGLMERDTLPPDNGMIFVFPKATLQAFWMHHTRFPLDIIFADEHGTVVSTAAMKAYTESTTLSDGPAKYAIELSAGSIAATGVKPGDKLQIPPAADAALKK